MEYNFEENGIMGHIREQYGPAGDADTYKMSQAPQYPKHTKKMISYICSRGGTSSVCSLVRLTNDHQRVLHATYHYEAC